MKRQTTLHNLHVEQSDRPGNLPCSLRTVYGGRTNSDHGMDPVTTETNCRKGSRSIPGTGWNDALSGIQSSMLERIGCTCIKARQIVWRNQPSDQQSLRAHLTPNIRGINGLTNNLKDTKEFMMEMFQGVLTLYYSAEVCHSLRGKDFNNMQHIVDDMEAAWESRPYSERTKMHRTAAERMFNNRRQQWTRPQDAHPTQGTGLGVGVSLLGLKGYGQKG